MPGTVAMGRSSAALAVTREALIAQRRMRLRYASERGEETERTVRPLGVFFWGKTWTLAAWCELRNGFRNFRLDRLVGEPTLQDRFDDEPGRTLRDMLSQYGPAAVRLLD
jgi:predicted DNA-binding transcriptional regulator YafY